MVAMAACDNDITAALTVVGELLISSYVSLECCEYSCGAAAL